MRGHSLLDGSAVVVSWMRGIRLTFRAAGHSHFHRLLM
jgi:hypothetical protein